MFVRNSGNRLAKNPASEVHADMPHAWGDTLDQGRWARLDEAPLSPLRITLTADGILNTRKPLCLDTDGDEIESCPPFRA